MPFKLYFEERKVIRSLVADGVLLIKLLFIVTSMSWIRDMMIAYLCYTQRNALSFTYFSILVVLLDIKNSC